MKRKSLEVHLFYISFLFIIQTISWRGITLGEKNDEYMLATLKKPVPSVRHNQYDSPYNETVLRKSIQFGPYGNNVLIVTNGIQPLVPNGGVSMMFTRYVEILRKNNHVQVLVPYTNSASPASMEFWAERNVSFNSILNSAGKNDYGTAEMRRSFQILKWILASETTFDVIIFHDYRGTAVHTIQMKMTGTALQSTKIVVTCHTSSRHSDMLNLRKIHANDLIVYGMEDYTRTYADLTLFPSHFFSKKMQEESEMIDKMRNVHVIPNFLYGVHPPQYRNITKLKTRKLAYYGRVDRLKGIEFIFRALEMIEKGKIEEFLILGDINSDDLKDLVKSHAEHFEREKYMNFTVVKPKRMEEAMAFLRENNYAVLLASYYETYSCALQELVYFGIPVLFSNAGGTKEVVKDTHSMYEIEDTVRLYQLITEGLQEGFELLELENHPDDSIKKFNEMVFASTESTTAIFEDCLDVTVGIVTKGRKDLVTELVVLLREKQTCSGFSILILNNDNTEYLFLYNTTQILRDDIITSEARNEIIRHCETKYLVLFDDDDLPLPDMLFNLKSTLVNSQSALASAPCNNVIDNSFEKVSLTSGYTNLGANLLIHHTGKATVILDVAFMQKIGGLYVEEGIERSSPFVDWNMYSKVMLHGGKISLYPLPVYNYVKNSTSSLYYTATDAARHWGQMKILKLHCQELELAPSLCALLQKAKDM